MYFLLKYRQEVKVVCEQATFFDLKHLPGRGYYEYFWIGLLHMPDFTIEQLAIR
jgi:hypothetical protein